MKSKASVACSAALALSFGAWSAGAHAASSITSPERTATATPIKHVIVVIGENRSFDNVFATYVPPKPDQKVWNLLSQGIVDKDGNLGPMAVKALQHQAIDSTVFQLSPGQTGSFPFLPQPSTGLGALPVSLCEYSLLDIISGGNPAHRSYCSDIALHLDQQYLLWVGGTGQKSFYQPPTLPVPDCRYPSNLPNGPYALVGASKLNTCGHPYFKLAITPTRFYDDTGDPVHRFFQMWQQNDCSSASMAADNPSGCTHDLYPWVATTVGWQITANGQPPTDDEGTFQGGLAMGFYNMQAGEYKYFSSLADDYSINDNYHQPLMGGTGPDSQALLTGDVYYATDANGNPITPPSELIENPDPTSGSNNFYTNDSPGKDDLGNTSTGGLVNCSDANQPGVAAINAYLASLPYKPFNGGNCAAGHYYQVDNEYPSYSHTGGPVQKGSEFPAGPAFALGPQTIPTIGDALSANGISWTYYGEGFPQAAEQPLANQLYCAICNAFQYARSIMTTNLKNNLTGLEPFFDDVRAGSLPSVSFVKPDALTDSHPGMSTPPLFEGLVRKVVESVRSNPALWADTVILITFDESGGYYDSGYIQPIDFFGDGPRTVMIAVSPFAKPGHVDHTYADHASILKFIERNWGLGPLSSRSRDNLPNPTSSRSAAYFPTNSPAIGDLMNMFKF